MAVKSNLSKTIRALTKTLAGKSAKPHIDTGRPLFWRPKGISVDTRISAKMTTETGENMTGTVVSLSDSGLQLLGSRQMADCLKACVLRLFRCKPTVVQLCFTLPSNLDPFDAVRVQCETVYARRTRHNTSRVGLKFLDFSTGQDTLAEYLLYREAIG
jgi:hypothetical protein